MGSRDAQPADGFCEERGDSADQSILGRTDHSHWPQEKANKHQLNPLIKSSWLANGGPQDV